MKNNISIKNIFKYFLAILTLIIVYKLLSYTINSAIDQQKKILELNFLSSINDIPQKTKWIYRENYIFLLTFFEILIICYLYLTYLPKMLLIHSEKNKNFILIFIILFLTLNYKTYIYIYSEINFYLFLSLLIVFYLLYINFPNHLNEIKKKLLKINSTTLIYSISVISFLQRVIALSLDENILNFGDDNGIFFLNAKELIEHKKPLTNYYSPGMTIFLYFNFKVFGITQFIPKLFLIIIGTSGLYIFLKLIHDKFRKKLLILFIGLIYIISSHYISFSNHFWNENLFHPLFSFFIYFIHKMEDKINYKYSIYIIILSILLTLLRSWFPIILLVNILFLIHQNKHKIHRQFYLIMIFFITIILNFYFNQNLFPKSSSLLSTNTMHFNFIVGNNPYSQGSYSNHYKIYLDEKGLKEGESINYLLLSKELISESLHNPIIILKNFIKKNILWFVGAGSPRHYSNYYQHPAMLSQYFLRYIQFIFLILGVLYLIKKKNLLFLFNYFLLLLIFIIFFVDYRFKLNIMQVESLIIAFGSYKFIKYILHMNSNKLIMDFPQKTGHSLSN